MRSMKKYCEVSLFILINIAFIHVHTIAQYGHENNNTTCLLNFNCDAEQPTFFLYNVDLDIFSARKMK